MGKDFHWDETLPSDGSTVAATEIRKLWADVATGISVSFDLDTGIVKPGGSYMTYESGAGVYNTEDMLRVDSSETIRLHYHASAFSFTSPSDLDTRNQVLIAGSELFLEHGTQPTAGYWLQQSGESIVNTTPGDKAFSFSSDGKGPVEVFYGAQPSVFVSSDETGVAISLSTHSVGGFRIRGYDLVTTSGSMIVRWLSSGTTGA